MAVDLPNELMQRISHLCCTDEATGRVLALVSKRWYINSRKAALQTVALRRAKHIVAFRKMINLLTPQARKEFKLKQLFIHCPGPDYDCTNSDNDEDYKDSEDDEDHADATTILEDEGTEDDSGMSTGSHDSDYEGFLKPAERLQLRKEPIKLRSEPSVGLASPAFDNHQYQLEHSASGARGAFTYHFLDVSSSCYFFGSFKLGSG